MACTSLCRKLSLPSLQGAVWRRPRACEEDGLPTGLQNRTGDRTGWRQNRAADRTGWRQSQAETEPGCRQSWAANRARALALTWTPPCARGASQEPLPAEVLQPRIQRGCCENLGWNRADQSPRTPGRALHHTRAAPRGCFLGVWAQTAST